MHLNVTDIEIFSRDDLKLDKWLKSLSLLCSLLLFLNTFFGYWISLNKTEFGGQTSNWTTFCFVVIVFYLGVKGLAVTAFLATIYQWERVLLGACCTSGVFFLLGLINNGLRANWFCSVLLVLVVIIYGILYLHLQSIEQCKNRGHHYTCRAGCIRHERVKFVDDRVFGAKGTLVNFFGTTPGGGVPEGAGGSGTHITFTNEPEPNSPQSTEQQLQQQHVAKAQNDPWGAPKAVESTTPTTPPITTISTQVEINSPASIAADPEAQLRRSTSTQQHRRQASQGQSASHLDASSLLQI